ncbi:MAG: cobalamin-dependent protein [Fibrobacteres bacterium]|nr:cobalamin-dependent protein [Fibrobacterota bacterium]
MNPPSGHSVPSDPSVPSGQSGSGGQAPIRFITAASLFDGHDAAIHIMRRVLVAEGAEVIHLGHDRSVQEVVDAAIQEDVQGIAISSYQGGHVEYFTFLVESLRARDCGHIRVYGGGGGVITAEEAALLHDRGVARIFSPEDGRVMGLEGMIRLMIEECRAVPVPLPKVLPSRLAPDDAREIGRLLTALEGGGAEAESLARDIAARCEGKAVCPVVGLTGTGGAGKSSIVDELLTRLLEAYPDKRIAVICIDPSRRKTGGALLGDRLRVNAAGRSGLIAGKSGGVFFRSLATRRAHAAMSATVRDGIRLMQSAGFDLVLLETAGIGQSDTEVTDVAGTTLYVMTPEYGASSQLEKIGMLDYADFVAVNKFEKAGAEDALRDVRKAWQRNRKTWTEPLEKLPVFGTCAHRFRDPGMNALCNALCRKLAAESPAWKGFTPWPEGAPHRRGLLPRERTDYLRRVAAAVEDYHAATARQAHAAGEAQHFDHAASALDAESAPPHDETGRRLRERRDARLAELDPETRTSLEGFDALRAAYAAESQTYRVRDQDIQVQNHHASLSGLAIPKVALPETRSWADQVGFLRAENVPGRFPYTSGVFPFKREGEEPTRMFAGEGIAERTNARFHYVSRGQPAVRLSTAFDSVTLYGSDPGNRPDIFGKVGNSGVSVCCLDDAKRLYSGFDLCTPSTSVSMTINGPAPMLLAYFFNAAIDAACERKLKNEGRWEVAAERIARWFADRDLQHPIYRGPLPAGHDGSGLGFLGLPASLILEPDEYATIRAEVLRTVRGTVQADILKEEQAQNTCIFSTEFALRLMGDTQEFFIGNGVRNFYSVSISGYHIAEAGANPITQLALTLANGFTYVEYYKARGMDVGAFAPNLSFFFSNGLDPEYAVIGRVARRIWAIAMRDLYGADARSQMLKYHIQTSGRSLHAREIGFNDIRTTLQALLAVADNCNSLHTNAYDEAVTTPTEASVRRAMAIQLILNREMGLMKNENPWQGSYFLEELTRKVEAEVLKIFRELDARGGVLGAMESNYQRGRIQDESMLYERRKQSGELPIIGVNTFLDPEGGGATASPDLIRSTDAEKQAQVAQVAAYAERFPVEAARALESLKAAAGRGDNLFDELMEAAKYCTLGSISGALFQVGGAYRRNT